MRPKPLTRPRLQTASAERCATRIPRSQSLSSNQAMQNRIGIPLASNHLTQRLLTNTKLYPAFADVKRPGSISLPRGRDKERPKTPKSKPAEPKLAEVKPAYPDCDPQSVTVEKVRSFPGTNPRTWGFTAGVLDAGTDEIVFDGSVCKFKVTSLPNLTFTPFVYTAANKKGEKYADGTDVPLEKPCLGKRLDKYVHITSEMSGRIRDAEIEHCNDHHRAFDLTYGKYIGLMKAFDHGFPAQDLSGCKHTVYEVFKSMTNIKLGELQDKFACLSLKTQLRDDGDTPWHGIDLGPPTYARDCKSVTYTPDYKTAMPEVGKHKSEEIITGCGVKE